MTLTAEQRQRLEAVESRGQLTEADVRVLQGWRLSLGLDDPDRVRVERVRTRHYSTLDR